MRIIESIRIALGSLRSNLLRTILATLGIAIGITAVSTLLSIGQSFQRFVQSQFAGLDTNAIIIYAEPSYDGQGIPAQQGRLSEADLAAIAELPNVRQVRGEYSQGGQLTAGFNQSYANVTGVRPDFLAPGEAPVLGRFVSAQDVEDRARVVVLGWQAAQQLFPEGRPLGRELLIQGLSFRVIGVMPPGGSAFRGEPSFVPLSTARDRVFPVAPGSAIEVSVATVLLEDTTQIDATERAVADLLRARHRLGPDQGSDFRFENFREFAEANNNILIGITAFLGVIGGIALLVGGIGIMNVMLVSVAERTQEIGLRKAVGARRRDILMQFLVESVMLSLVGGCGGLLITSILVQGGAIGIQLLFPDNGGFAALLLLDTQAVALALGFSTLIGLLAGVYPALRASRLAPIVALRTA